jgi:hypothetical protein
MPMPGLLDAAIAEYAPKAIDKIELVIVTDFREAQ